MFPKAGSGFGSKKKNARFSLVSVPFDAQYDSQASIDTPGDLEGPTGAKPNNLSETTVLDAGRVPKDTCVIYHQELNQTVVQGVDF